MLKLLEKTWPFFRLGEAKWQHFPTRWMLVTSSSASCVLDTENGDVYIRRTARDYPIPPLEWHETHQQLSETCNDGVMDVKDVRSWVQQFKEGRTSCENKPKEPRPRTSRSEDMIAHDFRIFRSSCKMMSTDPTDMPALAAILFHSQAAVFHNHLFHSRNHVSRLASTWPRLLRFFFHTTFGLLWTVVPTNAHLSRP
jgi:hypothetical protein